jgi:hypothetical protein
MERGTCQKKKERGGKKVPTGISGKQNHYTGN